MARAIFVVRTNWYCYVIKELVHAFSCASIELWMYLGDC